MLKYFANTPPSTHLLLLVLIPLLRWPAFLAGFYHADEALSLLVAERAWLEGPLYVGAWHAGPPLHIWFVEGFYALLGKHALLALRVFAVLWIYLMAVYLNGVVGRFKLLKRYEGLPGLMLATLASVPWPGLFFSAELLAMWPALVAYHRLLNLTETPSRNYGLMFQAGALLMLAALINYKALFLLAGALVAYLLLRSARLDELTAALGGMLVVLLALLGLLYLQGNLRAFEAIGLRYYLQRLSLTGSSFYPINTGATLQALALTWSLPVILALVGFVHFRLRFFSYVVKIRSLETVMAIWLVISLVMLVAKWRRLDLSDVHLLLPPVAFYAAHMLALRWPPRLRVLMLSLGLTGLLLSYLSGWSVRFPQALSWLPVQARPSWLYGPPTRGQPLPPQLPAQLDPARRADGIWIMDHQPHWYTLLDAPVAHRYVDFRLAYYKFPPLPGYQEGVAQGEAESRLFRAFAQHPPAYILDPHGWFPAMQQRYPSLFATYRPRSYDGIVVYSRHGHTARRDP